MEMETGVWRSEHGKVVSESSCWCHHPHIEWLPLCLEASKLAVYHRYNMLLAARIWTEILCIAEEQTCKSSLAVYSTRKRLNNKKKLAKVGMEWYACDIVQTVTSSTIQKFAKGVSPLFPSFSYISGCVLQVLYWSKCSSTSRKPKHILHGTTLTDAYLPTGSRPTLGITVHWPTGKSPKPDAKKIGGSSDVYCGLQQHQSTHSQLIATFESK